MTTFEWVTLIGVLICGFWALTQKLSKIETALVSKVDYAHCHEKREKCPCVRELAKLKERMSK